MRMNRSIGMVVVVMAALVGSLGTVGCVGSHARQNVGVPAVMLAAGGVEDDARAGIEKLPADQQAAALADLAAFDAALASKDRVEIAAEAYPRWPLVKAWAKAGIKAKQEAGAIGPNVANSLVNRLTQFDETLTRIVK